MKRGLTLAVVALLSAAPLSPAYVEIPYTLGRVCQESTTIVLVEVTKVNKEKGLIIYKKIEDIKGKHPHDRVRSTTSDKRDFHERTSGRT